MALAAEGASVAVGARTRAQVEAVAAELAGRGLALELDVTDRASCERAVADTAAQLGSPSVLVNAAGISPVRQRAEQHDVEAWRDILDVNLTGAFLMTRATAPTLLEHGGAVVMISSVTGRIASPRLAAYGASKAGLDQLTRTLAREWAGRGVRVNAVSPGYVETELTDAMLAVEHLREQVVAQTPLGRVATVEEIVPAVLFLASDEASYVTGAELLVDGGMAA
jgi:gluconate 5-dehydrogenase